VLSPRTLQPSITTRLVLIACVPALLMFVVIVVAARPLESRYRPQWLAWKRTLIAGRAKGLPGRIPTLRCRAAFVQLARDH